MNKNVGGSSSISKNNGCTAAAELHRNVACILGIPIDILTLDEVVARIGDSVGSRRRLFISTVNLNFIALSRSSPAFRSSLRASDICTADGMAVVALCRLLGIRIPERVAGSDFIASLAKRSAPRPHVGIFFFGGADDAGTRACSAVNNLGSPALSCCGHLNPGFGSVEELSDAIKLDEINASRADFLVVSLGAEKGQSWIVRNLGRLEPPVVSHLGASINFLAGTVQRAPRALQKMGIEWMWRIYQEPHLFARYAKDAAALAGLILTGIIPLRAWLSWGKWRHGAKSLEIARTDAGLGHVRLKLKGTLTVNESRKFAAEFSDAMTAASSISLDLGEVLWLDAYGAGCLLVKSEAAKRLGITVSAVGASRYMETGLKLFGLSELIGRGESGNRQSPARGAKEFDCLNPDVIDHPAVTLAGPKN